MVLTAMTPRASTAARPRTLTFSVDAALLRELGERLVGQAHIALAELIKNSYDADATIVDVIIARNTIVVRDNGHGMSYDEFERLWMRIGSPHKEREERSRTLQRPLTGSKGVGRLAAQFLAHTLELRSVSASTPDEELAADVDWDDAISRGSLTEARAQVRVEDPSSTFPGHAQHGTTVIMSGLKEDWGARQLVALARELWPLQPPFDRPRPDEGFDDEAVADPAPYTADADEDDEFDEPEPEGTTRDDEQLLDRLLTELAAEDDERLRVEGSRETDLGSFEVRLRTSDPTAADRFERQMRRVLDLWSARITGSLEASDARGRVPAVLHVDVEFYGGEHARLDIDIRRQPLHALDFEIRVYSLQHRQRYRIPVEEARTYLRRNGGVHVYDAGFHLPYYGAESDWLNIERDHANRLSLSKLLPEELNVSRGLNALPTNRRLYGVVRINTAQERRRTERERRVRDALTIQVSRDRLVSNAAYRRMIALVRSAIDFYAVEETKRRARESAASASNEPVPVKAQRVREVLKSHRSDIPTQAFAALGREIDAVLEAVESEAERQAAQAGLLATLATAGMSAIAFEHEFNRQLDDLDRLARRLSQSPAPEELDGLSRRLRQTISDARASRRLFSHLLDEQDVGTRRALRARPVLDSTRDQLQHFMRGVNVDHTGVDPDFRLPPASLAEWGSLFQNVYVNAVNAMLDSEDRRLTARAESARGRHRVLIQDTGAGVDLDSADKLFEPFERRQPMSADRRQLGFGGTGLGLTIVRMIAGRAGCTASFVTPDSPYNTAFELAWNKR